MFADTEPYYRAALAALRCLEQRAPTKRRFCAEADALSALRGVLSRMHAEGRPNRADTRRLVPDMGKRRVSKFQPCLPENLLNELVANRVFDLDGARKVVG